MARYVELRRHTDNDGDVLTEDGIRAALEIGRGLAGGYVLLVSSGAQRATQTLACFACALREPHYSVWPPFVSTWVTGASGAQLRCRLAASSG